MAEYSDFGIRLQNPHPGENYTTCPQCSPNRKKKNSKCLAVNIDKGVWHCNHCDWRGSLLSGEERRAQPNWEWKEREYTRPVLKLKSKLPQTLEEKAISFFKNRGISKDTMDEFGITWDDHVWMPESEEFKDAICFPFYRQTEVINVKYRAKGKEFRLAKGAEKIFFGLDTLLLDNGNIADDVIIVEGEMDAMALWEAGFRHVLSVPNGAPSEKAKNFSAHFDYLENSNYKRPGEEKGILDQVRQIYIAVDADAPGKRLEEELIRRLGPERCLRVQWPDSIKDANDVLLQKGPDAIKEAVKLARHTPIKGVYEVNDIADRVMALYDQGLPSGLELDWYGMVTEDNQHLYTLKESTLTTVMGIPGMGKSEFVENLMIYAAKEFDWRFAVFNPETQPPELAIKNLAEKFIGKPFGCGPAARMDKDELQYAMEWVDEHFKFILPSDDDEFMLKDILEKTKVLIRRYGIRGLVIDPYNNLDDSRPRHLTSAEYLGQSLRTLNIFKMMFRLWCCVVVHPTKMPKDPKTGQYEVPGPYDAMGGSHWFNKTDFGITVHRDKTDEDQCVDIHVWKVKMKHLGSLGIGHLDYDKPTCRFYDAVRDSQTVRADIVSQSKKKKEFTAPKKSEKEWWKP
jgi:twinkle protein